MYLLKRYHSLMVKKGNATSMVHAMPADFNKAVQSDSIAKKLWVDITLLARNEWVCWVTSAKKEETRKRRIAVGLDKMHKGMRRPCCWAGCPSLV